MKEINQTMLEEIMNKQMEIAGYNIRYQDLLDYEKTSHNISWFNKFPITQVKADEFNKWLRDYLKKNKFTKMQIDRGIGWVLLDIGLTIKD